MNGISSFLFSLILAGLFAGVARLILPERFSSALRLLKALCAVILSLVVLSPFFQLLSDAQTLLENWEARFLAAPRENEKTSAPAGEALVEDEAFRILKADLDAYLSSIPYQGEYSLSLDGEDGINRGQVVISYDGEDFPARSITERLERRWGVSCRIEGKSAEDT